MPKTIPFDEVVELVKLMNYRSNFYEDSQAYDETDKLVKIKQKELGLEGLVNEREDYLS